MEHHISTIVSSIVTLYLPFEDNGTKLAVALAIGQMCSTLFTKISGLFTFLPSITNWFWKENYIIIDRDNPTYHNILDYFYAKYNSSIKGCKLKLDYGKKRMEIESLQKKEITEYFDNKHKIKMKIIDTGQKQTNDDGEINDKAIKIYGTCRLDTLERFVDTLISKCNNKKSNELVIYKLTGSGKKDNKALYWKQIISRTSKRFSNTIVSKDVEENLFDDIKSFMGNEERYARKGLPYKRGYILHGEPGCGKTSIIKALANEYNLPIFLLDLSIVKNNNNLLKVAGDINSFVSSDQKYLFVMEDVDRSKMFKPRPSWYDEEDEPNSRTITEDCLLNVLDGVDENYGRIAVMTTNTLKAIKKVKALTRPGRIDRIVNLTYCNTDQINRIMKFFFNKEEDYDIKDGIVITPAKLTQLIQVFKDDKTVLEILVKYQDLNKVDVDVIKNERKEEENNPNQQDEPKAGKSKKDDDSDDEQRGMTYTERRVQRSMVQLQRWQEDLKKMEKTLDIKSEENKLSMEQKKISIRLLELRIQKQKEDAINRAKRRKIKITSDDIGLAEYLRPQDKKKGQPIDSDGTDSTGGTDGTIEVDLDEDISMDED